MICDSNGLVVTVKTFPGNLHDSVTFFDTYQSLPGWVKMRTYNLALDAGYKTPGIAKFLAEEEITGYFPYKKPMTKKGFFRKYEYAYDKVLDQYVCPMGEALKYSTTNRGGYREYKSNKKQCENCPLKDRCTQSQNSTKVITRHIWQEYLDEAEFTRHTRRWKEIYPRRKETIERVFAENKEHHNLRFTRLRGLQKNQDQATMIFACHNLVKLARWKWNKA